MVGFSLGQKLNQVLRLLCLRPLTLDVASRAFTLSIHARKERTGMMVSKLIAGLALGLSQPATEVPTVVGLCRFAIERLSFAGSPAEQARCLLTSLEGGTALPAKLLVAQLLARYFVIHDTSTPYYGDGRFPDDVDRDPAVNSFAPYFPANADPEKVPVAHLFLNRVGEVRMGQPLSRPWRATKLETRVIGLPARGLFLHVETVMPRRRDPKIEGWNDAIAPRLGFSKRQYDRLALLYIALSVRAGAWLIPAQHATIDHGLPQAHDDPQNFRLKGFDRALRRHLGALGR
jgi:hypothetical protein